MPSLPPIDVYLEIGSKRTFAGALEWPGWCRSGPDPDAALAALLDYGARYAAILQGTRLGFLAPADGTGLRVVERIRGNATTDFGAPGIAPKSDANPVDDTERGRFEKLLGASWRAFDAAALAARGKTLRTGPRGGGRSLDAIVEHVLEADEAYLGAVGWKRPPDRGGVKERLTQTREAIVTALGAAARGEIPAKGPRGGVRWTARYFVRRVAWHAVAHAWEIDRRAS
ncbi:MAG: hypothetical protein ACKVZ0_09800 [Gemmatimonadales bacterium]